MAPMAWPSLMGPVRTQERPRSGVASKWTRQPSSSVLEPARIVPSAKAIGLFLIG